MTEERDFIERHGYQPPMTEKTMPADKQADRMAMGGFRPITEGYQPRLPGDAFHKGFAPDAPRPGASTPPLSPPSGGSSAAKPLGKLTG